MKILFMALIALLTSLAEKLCTAYDRTGHGTHHFPGLWGEPMWFIPYEETPTQVPYEGPVYRLWGPEAEGDGNV